MGEKEMLLGCMTDLLRPLLLLPEACRPPVASGVD